ncbi:MAG: hypothetical protein R2731_05825 [Nocardioides sp.]
MIVRDMWLTGFDSPPMHHVRRQADEECRADAGHHPGEPDGFKDKPSGLIVDYFGIAENLKDALATYTDRDEAGPRHR